MTSSKFYTDRHVSPVSWLVSKPPKEKNLLDTIAITLSREDLLWVGWQIAWTIYADTFSFHWQKFVFYFKIDHSLLSLTLHMEFSHFQHGKPDLKPIPF